MKYAGIFLSIIAICAAAVGCSEYKSGQPETSAGNERAESQNLGSATDVLSNNGTEVNTNNLNKADVGIGGPMQQQSGNYESQPLPGQNADDELARQIRVALTTGSVGTTGAIAENQLTAIQVQSRDGHVTITGPVGSEQEKQTIEKRVAGMGGVKSVQNKLIVDRSADSKNPINARVPRTVGNQ
jgi:hypothetical protein